MKMSKFRHHSSCPECGSSDGLAIYEDNENCFVCPYHKNYDEGEDRISDKNEVRHAADRNLTPVSVQEQIAIRDRGIAAGSVNKYKVTVNTNPESPISHVYPYFDINGAHVANKVRRKGEKAFFWEGDVGAGTLFGQQLFPAGGRAITIVEGECDALAGFQLTGSKYPCVSVKSSSEAKRNCADNFEYLDSFEKIVVCMDNDDPGQKAANQIAQLFAPGKVHILKLEKCKDPNDYLMKGLEKDYVNEWFRAPPYMPDGLRLGSDMELLDEIINYKEPECIPYPWAGLNQKLYGIRLSELTLFTADTGIGKTTFMKEIEYALLQSEELKKRGYGVGFLHLEEPKRETLLGMLSIHHNKPYHLPDTPKSEEDIRKAYKEVLNNKRVVVYDHFGSNEIDTILAKIRHMVALGCRYIVLDHLSIIVSDQSGDERKQLDEISTKLKSLTMNLQISVVAVIHINRQGQVRGSAGPEQVSNNVVRLTRDKKEIDEWRRNVTQMDVEKCRLSGRTGPACWIFYNNETGRLEELSPEMAKKFQEGGSNAGGEFEAYN
jgi:twinkle protein